MCGIAGIVSSERLHPDDRDRVVRMRDVIAHRGPDDAGLFIDEQAAQCGYCIAGMVMRAQALLDRNPDVSDAEIRAWMEPNLCRCGTHMRILRAIRRASNALKASAPKREASR